MLSTSTPSNQSAGLDQSQKIQELLSEIRTLAKVKDFVGAEKVRDTLIEIAPMALQEIIESAEIIEKEKSVGIDPEHLALWDDLYKDLSEEEKNCIFYSMGKIVVPEKKKILSKGKYNDRLFFIEDGKVAVYKTKGDKNILVAQLGRGNLLGEYTFTTISLCSASALTQSEVTMYHLKSSATDDWDENILVFWRNSQNFVIKKETWTILPAEGKRNNGNTPGTRLKVLLQQTSLQKKVKRQRISIMEI